jgi:hypothetical protein
MSSGVDFKILNELAARLGEDTMLEMAKAYIASVNERRAGIPPPAWENIPIDTYLIKNPVSNDGFITPKRPSFLRQPPGAPARALRYPPEISPIQTKSMSKSDTYGYFE